MQARLILLGMVLAQLSDATTFTTGIALHGIHLESNGIAAAAYSLGGLDAVLLMKGAAILAILGLLVSTATRFPRLLVMGGATATSIGLLGFITNVTSLALLA